MKTTRNVAYWRNPQIQGTEICEVNQSRHVFPDHAHDGIYAVNMIMVKRLSDRYNPWLLTALQVFAGSVFFSPGLILLIRHPGVNWTAALIFSIVFLGALVTLGAFGIYNWGMSRIPASQASTFINLVQVTAVAIGWMVMGESLNRPQCVAAAAVIIGVGISRKINRQA